MKKSPILYKYAFLLLLLTTYNLRLTSAVSAESQLAPLAPQKITITVSGLKTHLEYRTVTDELKKIGGLTEIIPARLSNNSSTLSGNFAGDEEVLINDLKAFAMDRFKFDKKGSGPNLKIFLEKL